MCIQMSVLIYLSSCLPIQRHDLVYSVSIASKNSLAIEEDQNRARRGIGITAPAEDIRSTTYRRNDIKQSELNKYYIGCVWRTRRRCVVMAAGDQPEPVRERDHWSRSIF